MCKRIDLFSNKSYNIKDQIIKVRWIGDKRKNKLIKRKTKKRDNYSSCCNINFFSGFNKIIRIGIYTLFNK